MALCGPATGHGEPEESYSTSSTIFRTELSDLVIGQKPVQPLATNLHDRSGAARGIKYLIDLFVALVRHLINRDVALVPTLALIRTDPRDLIKHASAKPLERVFARAA